MAAPWHFGMPCHAMPPHKLRTQMEGAEPFRAAVLLALTPLSNRQSEGNKRRGEEMEE